MFATSTDYRSSQLYPLGPSKFAVDPAADNGDVSFYACRASMTTVGVNHVLRCVRVWSEGPRGLL